MRTHYLYLCGQVISLMMSVLCQKICVGCAYVELEPREIELTCQFQQTQRRHGFTNPRLQ
jgi:hypothetical protein